MRPLILLLLLPVIATAKPKQATPPPPKPAAVTELEQKLDLRERLMAGIRKAAGEQAAELDAAKKENETVLAENAKVKEEVAAVRRANAQGKIDTATLDKKVKEVTAWGNERAVGEKYWKDKHEEARKKLWWWRLWAGGALVLGLLLIFGGLLMRFTTWGARTIGPVVTKVAAQFIRP